MHKGGTALVVTIASDSFLLGDGLTALLADVPGIAVRGRAHNLDELCCLLANETPDAVILSVRSLVVSTEAIVAAVRAMRQTYPDMGIVVVSDRVDSFGLELLQGGSSHVAFLLDEHLPSIDAVVSAVYGTCEGQVVIDPGILDTFIRRRDVRGIDQLTPREVCILKGVAHGQSNKAIAEDLCVSLKTIEKGITAIFEKLGPFHHGFSDRRVSVALMYLRLQSDPFGPQCNQRDLSSHELDHYR